MTAFTVVEPKEIAPLVMVYRGLIPSHSTKELSSRLASNRQRSSRGRFYEPWKPWFVFGDYASPVKFNAYASPNLDAFSNEATPQTEEHLSEEIGIFAILQIAAHSAIHHYVGANRVPLHPRSFITEPNLAVYSEGGGVGNGRAMNYHTDWNTGEWFWPGEKFFLTCTIYPNDNYEGGEIQFCIGNAVYTFKPRAGDVVVFPSGDPRWPGEDCYFHGVKQVTKGTKFLCRAYLKYTSSLITPQWEAGLAEHGDDWANLVKEQAKHQNMMDLVKIHGKFYIRMSQQMADLYGYESTPRDLPPEYGEQSDYAIRHEITEFVTVDDWL